jgi:hypothetical protein
MLVVINTTRPRSVQFPAGSPVSSAGAQAGPVKMPRVGRARQDKGPARDGRAKPRPASSSRATVGAPHLVALVCAGARFENGERPDDQTDHESGGHAHAA